MPIFHFGEKGKTFKPMKTHGKGTKRGALHDFAQATLGTGDMFAAVSLPPGEEENEWLATHTVDFYNEISLLYGTITDFCTPESCPSMTAGSKYEYLWADPPAVPKPVKVSAPEYVDLLMSWIEGQMNNEVLFPTTVDTPFPKGFKSTIVRNIFRRLFRVYGHIYHHHFDKIVELAAEAHLNTCFKHFAYFVLAFDLIDRKELAPLEDLINRLTNGALDRGLAAASAAAAAGGAGAAAGAGGDARHSTVQSRP